MASTDDPTTLARRVLERSDPQQPFAYLAYTTRDLRALARALRHQLRQHRPAHGATSAAPGPNPTIARFSSLERKSAAPTWLHKRSRSSASAVTRSRSTDNAVSGNHPRNPCVSPARIVPASGRIVDRHSARLASL